MIHKSWFSSAQCAWFEPDAVVDGDCWTADDDHPAESPGKVDAVPRKQDPVRLQKKKLYFNTFIKKSLILGANWFHLNKSFIAL